uniref:AAA family ATPase n=1 Tax=Paraburkholderia kururiensis TaxID=984307 RepID=UPI0018F40D13
MNLHDARESIGQRLSNVAEIAPGILRGVRLRGKDVFASYVFDLNNEIPSTVGKLNEYLDDIVGPQYFDESASLDLRWNNYLYFVVARRATDDATFFAVKRQLEADRSYARKYVVFEDEFDRILNELDSIAGSDDSVSTTDVVEVWTNKLSAAGLNDVADADRPIADVVRGITSGTAKRSTRQRKESGVVASRQLVSADLVSINLSGFRQLPRSRHFDGLSKVNLLFGPNGVGKTSFLEGIEFLFCGANRRSDAGSHSSVVGLLKSGQEVKTSGSQHMSDFKTRQRLWYGNDDTSRQNNLPNQFARFNFLNTDAAAELSLLKAGKASEGSNAEILADLLSGPEANLMWRRIENVRRAVSEELRGKRAEGEVVRADQRANAAQIKILENAPREADAEFSVFAKDLRRIGWTTLPQDKQDVSAQLLDTLTDLASQFGVVLQLDWVDGVLTDATAANHAEKLRQSLEKLNELASRKKENEQNLKKLSDISRLIASRKAALASFEVEAVDDLQRLSERLKAFDEELSRNARQFSLLPTLEAPDGWETDWGTQSLSEAVGGVKSALDTFDAEISQMQRQVAEQTATQTQLQAAMAQLRNLVYKIVEHRHSDRDCPVCGTEFEPGELFRHLEEQASTRSEVETSELRREVDKRKAQMERLRRDGSWLEQVAKFATGALDGQMATSVGVALHAAADLATRQRELADLRREALARIEGYSRAGLTLDRIRELCAPLDPDVPTPTNSTDVTDARRQIDAVSKQLSEQFSRIEDELRRDTGMRT